MLVSRWTFAFLLLHNLAAIASYAANVAAAVPGLTRDIETTVVVYRSLDEVLLLLIVLAVPVSYLAGVCAHCCACYDGDAAAADVEMDKMDKIYQEVNATSRISNTGVANVEAIADLDLFPVSVICD